MLGDLLSAGLKLFGIGSEKKIAEQNRQSQERINAQNIANTQEINRLALADKEQDRALQKEFAQTGIQWKAKDALAAGIHPIYGLGGSTATYTPSAVSLGTPSLRAPTLDAGNLAENLGSMGQDIGRAINATRSAAQRDVAFNESVRDLSLKKMGLENELLSSQIAKIRAGLNPPMPGGKQSASTSLLVPEASKFEDRPLLAAGNTKFKTDSGTSNQEDYEKRYGDMADWIGPYILWRDYMANTDGGVRGAEERLRAHYIPGGNIVRGIRHGLDWWNRR